MSEDTKLRMKMERELELRRSNLDELKSRLNEQDAERHESQNERSKQTSPKASVLLLVDRDWLILAAIMLLDVGSLMSYELTKGIWWPLVQWSWPAQPYF
ncbi:uncharacterized protein YALI1_A09149g [Yarrowia lipolytica]|uniref:Uncharacterized protein n=1 Tax=Yarrowia lipolytica TaxID=4952 RepID=A0A1D8N477_YARLL|nr:hypothetical protein YALI1_A09149g [Yarrowia lipolytica]